MTMPIDLLDEMKSVFDTANVVGKSLNGDVKFIDWGGWIPPLPSTQIPFIFLTVDSSLYPIKRVAAGAEQAYDEEYNIFIHIGIYIVKGDDGEEGYKAAMRQAIGIVRAVVTLCHLNRITKWNDTCYDAWLSEEDPADWGTFPLGAGTGELAYGISLTLTAKSISS